MNTRNYDNIFEAMIDIETLDTAPSAVVFQIGIVGWDDLGHTMKFILDLPVTEQLKKGRTVSVDTLAFWTNPDISAVVHSSLSVSHPAHFDLVVALDRIDELLVNVTTFWSKGSFDFTVLEHLYHSMHRHTPWRYYQCRDLRTLMRECEIPSHENISHNALDDALKQKDTLFLCRKKLELANENLEGNSGKNSERGDQQHS